MLIAVVLALVLLVGPSDGQSGEALTSGSSSCPCKTSFPSGADPTAVSLSGIAYTYPPTYGLSTCLEHDQGLPPFCTQAPVPDWCNTTWCYIDPSTCDKTHALSTYFPGSNMYYSYSTCGTANTYDSWFGAEAGSGAGSGGHSLVEITGVIKRYLMAAAQTLEDNEPEVSGTTGSCSPPSSCPCADCSTGTAASTTFGDQSIAIGVSTYTESGTASPRDECLASIVGETFLRVAAAEADPSSRLGYQYGAFQASGNYMQWPGVQWCASDYDPRFRPWYAAAASGPKSMVIVIDQSGSMQKQGRMALARTAATQVVDTLTEADVASVVRFSSDATGFPAGNQFLRMTEANKAVLKAYIADITEGGTTNFGAALSKALDFFEGSTDDSGCHKVVLFMSDGSPTSGTWSASQKSGIASRAAQLDPPPHILTYAFGADAPADDLQGIACAHNGVAYRIADGGNIADVMAAYFKILSPMGAPCKVRWSNYTDALSGQPLLAACLASYEKNSASSPTTCMEGDPGCVLDLLGVTCIDMGLLAPMNVLMANPGWDVFWAEVQAEQTQCARSPISEAQMQYLRSREGSTCPSGVEAQKCTAGASGGDVPPSPPSSPLAVEEGPPILRIIIPLFAVAAVLSLLYMRHKQMSQKPQASKPSAPTPPPPQPQPQVVQPQMVQATVPMQVAMPMQTQAVAMVPMQQSVPMAVAAIPVQQSV